MKNRIFKPVAEGGLGLFDVGLFLMAQKCSWIKRAMNDNGFDEWKRLIVESSLEGITHINTEYLNAEATPILSRILNCFSFFAQKYWRANENFRKAPIFRNEMIDLNRTRKSKITEEFFGELWPQYNREIKRLNLIHIHDGTNYLSIDSFILHTGIPLSVQKLTALRGAYDIVAARYKKASYTEKSSVHLEQFIRQFKKVAKNLEKY